MPLHLLAASHWLLAQAGGFLFSTITRRLSEEMGLSSRSLTVSEADILLDRYFRQFEDRLAQRLIDRLDEDRLATLNGAMKQMKVASSMAGMTDLKKGYLISASSKFFDIAQLPTQGRTGGFSNAELICLAYLGIAAIHLEMHEPATAIAENIVAAAYTNPPMVKQWFGGTFLPRLLAVCPQCGAENSPGAIYCQNDNYPLPVLPQESQPQAASASASTFLLPRYCSQGHPNPQSATTCNSCAELIIYSYCSLGHSNLLGAAFCDNCKEPLASLL